MQLTDITPLILTYNEAPNIGRTLSHLRWAREVVVVDSGSTDGTLEILEGEPNVRVLHRRFDTHARQWTHGVSEAGIETEWILALDADYQLSDAFTREVESLIPQTGVDGYRAGFRYCSLGKPLRGGVYPPVVVLFRRAVAKYRQDGHTQRLVLTSTVGNLRTRILHDDRKALKHWLRGQANYALLQADLIARCNWSELRWSDRLRRLYVMMPLLVPVYSLLVRGGLLDGKAGLHYALQRGLAEVAIALQLIELQHQNGSKR